MQLKKNFPIICLLVILAVTLIFAINPHNIRAWFLEIFGIGLFMITLILSYKKFRLSNLSYFLITIYLILTIIGAHYTYSEVPIDFINNFFGAERNNYDRIVHFSFGLLMTIPFREFLLEKSDIRGFWSYLFPLIAIFGASAIYEIIEWGVSKHLPLEAGRIFVSMQGDVWDAQKDMFLAGLGSVAATMFSLLKNLKKQKPISK